MVVAIHQPHYFPWIGYFDKMAKSDMFILLDDVQMEKGSYMYRNRILDAGGRIVYLTISGDKHGFMDKKYREIQSKNDEQWLEKHKTELTRSYQHQPYFQEVWQEIEELFETQESTICAYCMRSIQKIKEILQIQTKVVLQSEIEAVAAKKNDLVLGLCKAVDATVYLSGNGARKYTDEDSFAENGILLTYQKFEVPEYKQDNAAEFVPGLSILDMLFHCGIEKTRSVFWEVCSKRGEF